MNMAKKRIYVNEKVNFISRAVIQIPDDMEEKSFNGILDRVQRHNEDNGTFDDVLHELRDEGFKVISQESSFPDNPDDCELEISDYDDVD
jgi:hypothetical protein